MILSQIAIRRPVLTTMMCLGLILFGLLSLQRLPVRELPDIDPPVVNVLTVYPGASAEVIETEVTERIEEAVNSIAGIKKLTSISREQVGNVAVEFNLGIDIDVAAQDVRDRVARIRGFLPGDIDEPVVSKQDAAAQPIMWVALFGNGFTTEELTRIAERQIKDRLQTVPGVSSVVIGGEKRFAIRLRLDSEKMAARGVTVGDISLALREQNVELPSGRVENVDRELTIQTRGELRTAAEYENLVVRRIGNSLVRLRDIGRAEDGVEDERSIARYNSEPAVGLGIVRQSRANTIEVAKGVRATMEEIRPGLPDRLQIFYAYDESDYVEKAVTEVWETLGIAFCLVVLTIFIFLRNVRSTIVPTLAIPVSLIAVFGALYILGYSINILTLLALVLAIGIVVDDSIVVLENIYRHIEAGTPPMEAAKRSMDEIGFAIVSITLSLVAVFLPLAFLQSTTGRLFVEFATALAGSVVISAFVALTLAPMVASRVLKPIDAQRHGRIYNFFERRFEGISARYRRVLGWALRHRPTIVLLAVASLGLSAVFYLRLEKEFLPSEDKGRLFSIAFAPVGSTAEYTDRMVRQMEAYTAATPEVEGYFSAVALPYQGPGDPTLGFMFVRLNEDRDRHVRDIVGGPDGLGSKFFGGVEGAFAVPITPKAIDISFGQPFQLVIMHRDLEALDQYVFDLSNRLQALGYLPGIRSNFGLTKPELRVEVDRDRAAALGISIEEIARTLQVFFGGLDLSKVRIEGKEYDVIAQLDRESRLVPADLDRLYVRNQDGRLIQLSNVVRTSIGAGPTEIQHYNRQRSAIIEATPAPGVALGRAVDEVEAIVLETLPPGFSYAWAGEVENLIESGADVLFLLVFAVIAVYMVLAAQFESLVHPVTVLTALLLAFVGAFGALWLLAGVSGIGEMLYGWANYAPDPPGFVTWLASWWPRISGMNDNIFSRIGLVLLAGLVTKNSILLVEFANRRMREGKSAREAMYQAGLIRLRPILMTSVATIAGILPIAIGFGASGEGRRPLGVVAVGGMITSTLLTLVVVPVLYTLFAEFGAWVRRRIFRRTAEVSPALTEGKTP